MGLFDYKDHKIVLNPDAIAIPPFRKLWDRDKSKTKHKATQELTYIYFMYDFKSPYNIYQENDRKSRVMGDYMKDPGWKPDAAVKVAIDEYNDFQRTYSMRFLESARGLADKLSSYFDEVDFHATDESGKLLYSAKDAVSNLKQVGDVIESLDKVEEKVRTEVDSKSKIRGQKDIKERER
jgi:hypothetical protein